MTRCGFGYPVKPGSKTVFFCDDEATCAFNQPVAGVPGYVVRVRVCDEHAEWLRFEYLARTQSTLPGLMPCTCGDPTAPGVNHRMTGPCHVDLGVETHEDVVKHTHTEAECGHKPVQFDGEDGLWECEHCNQLNPRERWCGDRCEVFRTELIESVKLAERTGDFPAHADEMMTEREDDTR